MFCRRITVCSSYPYRLQIDRLSVACHPMVSLFSNQTWAYGLLL
jgi:hypothetical protein